MAPLFWCHDSTLHQPANRCWVVGPRVRQSCLCFNFSVISFKSTSASLHHFSCTVPALSRILKVPTLHRNALSLSHTSLLVVWVGVSREDMRTSITGGRTRASMALRISVLALRSASWSWVLHRYGLRSRETRHMVVVDPRPGHPSFSSSSSRRLALPWTRDYQIPRSDFPARKHDVYAAVGGGKHLEFYHDLNTYNPPDSFTAFLSSKSPLTIWSGGVRTPRFQ